MILDGVIHLLPRGVTRWRCALSSKFFDHLLLLLLLYHNHHHFCFNFELLSAANVINLQCRVLLVSRRDERNSDATEHGEMTKMSCLVDDTSVRRLIKLCDVDGRSLTTSRPLVVARVSTQPTVTCSLTRIDLLHLDQLPRCLL